MTFLFLLVANNSFANGTDVELRLKVMTQVFKTSQIIDEQIMANNISEKEIERLIREEYKTVISVATKNIIRKNDPQYNSKLQSIIDSINYRTLTKYLISKAKLARSYVRNKGLSYISYVILTNLLQFTVPSILLMYGLNIPALISFYVLSDIPSYLYYRFGEALITKQRMENLFGSREKFIEYNKNKKEIIKYHDFDVNKFIYKHNGKHFFITSNSMWNKALHKLGLKQSKFLSLEILKKLIKKNSSNDEIVKTIIKTKNYSDQFKTVLLLHHMSTTSNLRLLLDLNELIRKKSINYTTQDNLSIITNTILNFKHINNASDFQRELINLSTIVKSQAQFFELYQNVIIPYLSKNNEHFSLENFRNLNSFIYKFKVDAHKSEANVDSYEFQSLLSNYIKKSFSTQSSKCFRKLDSLFQKILLREI